MLVSSKENCNFLMLVISMNYMQGSVKHVWEHIFFQLKVFVAFRAQRLLTPSNVGFELKIECVEALWLYF